MRKTKVQSLGLSRKGKKVVNSNPRLFTISDNERNLLLGERIVSILENASSVDDYNIPLTDDKSHFPQIPKRLASFRNKDCPLWTKASVPCEPGLEESYQQKLFDPNRVKQVNANASFVGLDDNNKLQTPDNHNIVDVKQKHFLQLDNNSRPGVYCDTMAVNNSSELSHENDNDNDHESDLSQELFESESEDLIPSSQASMKKIFPVFEVSHRSQNNETRFQNDSTLKNCIVSNKSAIHNSDFETPKRMKENMPRTSIVDGNPSVNQNRSCSSMKDWKPPKLSNSDHADLGQDLLSLFLEKIDSDLTVYGREEKAIRVHKLILKARCPKLLNEIVMEKTSKLGRKKEVIPLPCFSHTAVKSLLCYIYCGRILPPAFDTSDLCQKDMNEIVELGLKYRLDLSLSPQAQSSFSIKHCAKIPVQTKDVMIQTDNLLMAKDVGFDVDVEEKATQTEKEEMPDALALVDERAQAYREKSHSPSDNLNDAFGFDASRNLFEESFSDKIFANKLVDDDLRLVRKRRSTWSEKSSRFSSHSDNSDNSDDDDDSVIIVEDEKSDKEKKDLDLDLDDKAMRDKSPGSTSSPARPSSQIFQTTWNKSFDDFFANLPSDEQLLNLPSTSPSESHTYTRSSPIPLPLPRSPSRSIVNVAKSKLSESQNSTGGTKKGWKRKARKNLDEQLEQRQQPQAKKCAKRISRSRGKESRRIHDEFDSDEGECKAVSGTQKGVKNTKGEPGKPLMSTPLSSSRKTTSGSHNRHHTPMLNYSLIDTPILKKELKRYGLKPLPRSKAKILLRHIYKETHK